MTSITRYESSEDDISPTIDAFFRTFAIGPILRRNGAYKTKGVPALRVFRTLFERGRSVKVELASRVFDRCKKRHTRGFRLLSLGWSDGDTFVPIESRLLASANAKSRLEEAKELDVIAIVKKGNARYRWDGKMVSVKDIYEQDRKRRGRSRYLLSVEVEVESRDGERSTPARLVFVRKRIPFMNSPACLRRSYSPCSMLL